LVLVGLCASCNFRVDGLGGMPHADGAVPVVDLAGARSVDLGAGADLSSPSPPSFATLADGIIVIR
jgi:hypothetical protein